jgi:hypothetical protein
MTASNNVSLLDLLDLPDSQREILLWLTRHGPADPSSLIQSINFDPEITQQTLDVLIEKGYIECLADGRLEAMTGRVRSRKTLPADLWHALLTTDRHYSEQEIVTLRTAVPILQLARARLVWFGDHGPGHALRVKSFACQLGSLAGLSEVEQGLLRIAALFHDVGNIVDRKEHHVISQETVIRMTAEGALPFTSQEAEIIGLLCRWHRKEYDPNRTDEVNGRMIRTGLLASVLRVADAMDIDYRRSDYPDRWFQVIRFFFPQEVPFWDSLNEILGLRILCKPVVELRVFTRGEVRANLEITRLHTELASSPFQWTIHDVPIPEARVDDTFPLKRVPKQGDKTALLIFPFEPHSIVMAALSRKNLAGAGHKVELLCYPDTAGSPGWLWDNVLPKINPAAYRRLVIIGDRLDPAANPPFLQTVRRWREAGVLISILNRHEASWRSLPSLLQLDVEVVLGGDWTYFWGDPASQQDMAWGRIAALCTRDPTQSTVGLTEEEEAVTRGFLKTVYDTAHQPASNTEEWAALVRPTLDRIETDDRAFFSSQAEGFAGSYAASLESGRVEGRVLLFESVANHFPQTCYWALEAAIERQGRLLERGIHFKVPYAIATWRQDDIVELLAINHWRDEEVIPIRLLYPGDLGPPPAGNEGTVRVRLRADQAERVVRSLLEACNQ